ncbi:MAG: hypothetical protein AAGG75_00725 [Bacteroidota bacterium]
MKFVPESTIDQMLERLEGGRDDFEDVVKDFSKQQPFLLGFLCSEAFELLTNEERDYMLYLSIVIWMSILQLHPGAARLPEKLIGDTEENNWEVLKTVTARRFRERIDIFFENYPQEDLLAFVEDGLVYDPEREFITDEGREYLFIALKTVIDSFDQYLKTR